MLRISYDFEVVAIKTFFDLKKRSRVSPDGVGRLDSSSFSASPMFMDSPASPRRKLTLYLVHGTVIAPKVADKKDLPFQYDQNELALIIKLDIQKVTDRQHYIYRVVQYRHGAFLPQNAEFLKPLRLLELEAEYVVAIAREISHIQDLMSKEDTLQELDEIAELDHALMLLQSIKPLTASDILSIQSVLSAPEQLLHLLQEMQKLNNMDGPSEDRYQSLQDTQQELLKKKACAKKEKEGLLQMLEDLRTRESGEVPNDTEIQTTRAQLEKIDNLLFNIEASITAQASSFHDFVSVFPNLETLASVSILKKKQFEQKIFNVIQNIVAREAGINPEEVSAEVLKRYEQDARFIQTLYAIACALNIDFNELTLCLDGNLGNVGGSQLSPLFYMFVEALKPTRLIPFSNTGGCVEMSKSYCAAHTDTFVGVAGETSRLRAMLAEVQSREIRRDVVMRISEEEKPCSISYCPDYDMANDIAVASPSNKRNPDKEESSDRKREVAELESQESPTSFSFFRYFSCFESKPRKKDTYQPIKCSKVGVDAFEGEPTKDAGF